MRALFKILIITIFITSTLCVSHAQPTLTKKEIIDKMPLEYREELQSRYGDELEENLFETLLNEFNRFEDNSFDKIQVSRFLADLGDKRAVEPFINALINADLSTIRCLEDFHISVSIAFGLGKLKDTRAVEPLISLINEKQPFCLLEAISIALGEIGDSKAIKPLVPLMKSKSRKLQKTVAEKLTNLGWKPKNQSEEITYLIAQGKWDELIKIGKPAVEQLINALDCWVYQGRGVSRKGYSIKALGEISDKRAIVPLIKYYTSIVVYGEFSGPDPSKILDKMEPNWRYHPEIGKAIERRLLYLKKVEKRVHNNSNMSAQRYNERVHREQTYVEEELIRLTGESFDANPEKWQSWYEANKNSYIKK
ncbi:HEAT repeat domain-containing protein [Thermodesulfobacteriota bacterium]